MFKCKQSPPRLESLESRLNPDASAQSVVTGLYHQLLLRDPDSVGLPAYTRALESGTSTSDVAAAIYTSREFRTAQAENYYENLLGRVGTTAEVAQWADRLFARVPEETVSAEMASSPEYTSRFASPSALVNRWYVDILGRQPDKAGLSAHTQALQSGRTNYEVVSAITNSNEYRQVKVRQVYFAALDRDVDSVGHVEWADRWQVLGGLAGVTSGILGSAENHARLVSAAGIPLPDMQLVRQWKSILFAPYDATDKGFVQMYNRLMQTNPLYDSGGDPIRNEPTNTKLWDLSRSAGYADGLPNDERLQVTPVTKPIAFPVLGLLPTQNEVDMSKSLKFPLTDPASLELYLKGGDIEHPGGLIITGGNGRYVLDGHHRWSTIYAINPHARILSVDIGQLANPAEYLKVTQIAVGADIGFLPVANASDANNLFNVDETKFKNFVASTILGNSDSGQAILEVFGRYGYKTMTEIQDYLWGNVLQLRANNRPALNVPREIMPQPLNGDPTPVASAILSGMLNFKGPFVASLG